MIRRASAETKVARMLKREESIWLFKIQARLWICYQLWTKTNLLIRRHLVYIMMWLFLPLPYMRGEIVTMKCFLQQDIQTSFCSWEMACWAWVMFPPLPEYEFLCLTRIHPVIKSQPPREGVPHRNWSVGVPRCSVCVISTDSPENKIRVCNLSVELFLQSSLSQYLAATLSWMLGTYSPLKIPKLWGKAWGLEGWVNYFRST